MTKVRMTNSDFDMGEHRINIGRVDHNPVFYSMWYHNHKLNICEHLPNQPTQKRAIAEARRILREKNNA